MRGGAVGVPGRGPTGPSTDAGDAGAEVTGLRAATASGIKFLRRIPTEAVRETGAGWAAVVAVGVRDTSESEAPAVGESESESNDEEGEPVRSAASAVLMGGGRLGELAAGSRALLLSPATETGPGDTSAAMAVQQLPFKVQTVVYKWFPIGSGHANRRVRSVSADWVEPLDEYRWKKSPCQRKHTRRPSAAAMRCDLAAALCPQSLQRDEGGGGPAGERGRSKGGAAVRGFPFSAE